MAHLLSNHTHHKTPPPLSNRLSLTFDPSHPVSVTPFSEQQDFIKDSDIQVVTKYFDSTQGDFSTWQAEVDWAVPGSSYFGQIKIDNNNPNGLQGLCGASGSVVQGTGGRRLSIAVGSSNSNIQLSGIIYVTNTRTENKKCLIFTIDNKRQVIPME